MQVARTTNVDPATSSIILRMTEEVILSIQDVSVEEQAECKIPGTGNYISFVNPEAVTSIKLFVGEMDGRSSLARTWQNF